MCWLYIICNTSLSASKICTFTEKSVHTSDLNVKKTSYFGYLTACLLTFERFKMKQLQKYCTSNSAVDSYFSFLLFKNNSSNIKSQKEVTNKQKSRFFLYFFCLMMERSGSLQIMADPDPGGPKNTDPDPQHRRIQF
jgi:hypothetical protein